MPHSHRGRKAHKPHGLYPRLLMSTRKSDTQTSPQDQSSVNTSKSLLAQAVTFFTIPTAVRTICFSAPGEDILQLTNSSQVNLTQIIGQCNVVSTACPSFTSTMIEVLCDKTGTLAALSNFTNVTLGTAGDCISSVYNSEVCKEGSKMPSWEIGLIILACIIALGCCCRCKALDSSSGGYSSLNGKEPRGMGLL